MVAGVGAGLISTAFGIGGGALSTPAIRALGTSALMSIGTTLPPVLPGVITGVLQYRGKGLIRTDIAVTVAIPGAIAAVGGSLISHHLPGNGHVIMLITAGVLLLNAIRLAQSPKGSAIKTIPDTTNRPGVGVILPISEVGQMSADVARLKDSMDDSDVAIATTSGGARSNSKFISSTATEADAVGASLESIEPAAANEFELDSLPLGQDGRISIKGHYARLISIGVVAGLISGGLGLGGGIVLVPVFARKIGLALRESTATSLVCIGILAIPSIITHGLIGDIDWTVAALLTIGTIPGAHFGAKLAMRASDIWLRRSASAVLSIIAIAYAVNEVMSITRH